MGQPQLGKMSPVESHRGLYWVHCYLLYTSTNFQIYMLVDDTKMYRHISDGADSVNPQADLECLQDWSENGIFVFIHTNASPLNLESREYSPSAK